jgi:hypothetical protein
MNSANRRTGRYLYSSASWSAPRSVRAPHHATRDRERADAVSAAGTDLPVLRFGEVGLEVLDAEDGSVDPCGRLPNAAWASVRAITPATAPLGGNTSIWLSSRGSAASSRGKYTAALRASGPFKPSSSTTAA